jgi:hypothetical protein
MKLFSNISYYVKFAREQNIKPQNLANFTMKPSTQFTNQSNFLKPWLSSILNPSHELYRLANQIDWKILENEFETIFAD